MPDRTARRRRPGSTRTRGVVASSCLLLVACSAGPPEIDSGDLSAADARTCRELVADLPDTLVGQQSVEVSGDSAYGAAWGDPPIVLTCGVGPADLSDLPGCSQVDGVGWLVPPDETGGDRDATFTADGYRPRVRLEVPRDYLPEKAAAALGELAGPVKRHLERVERCL
ncbi:DUF3515 domain-containing protein [Nocardioides sp. MAHUQ-72]|uniref:DUF3515 domain-containing protein n=1 Tax=unclassified Nocardioides TaxID=2615069 RepID=UPI003615DE68